MQTQHIGFAERLSAVIGLIYETASDESLWPQLLEGLAELVLESKGAAPVLPNGAHKGALTGLQGLPLTLAPSEAEQYLLACLAPHFTRSQEMQRALQETEIERDLLERVMDRLPLGMAIVDAQGRAISMNRAMLSLLQTGAGLALQDGRLVSAQPQQLPQAIAQVLARRQSHACLRLCPMTLAPILVLRVMACPCGLAILVPARLRIVPWCWRPARAAALYPKRPWVPFSGSARPRPD